MKDLFLFAASLFCAMLIGLVNADCPAHCEPDCLVGCS